MEKDSKFTRDENGYIAIRTVSAPYSSGSDDKDSMFTRDAAGFVAVRTIGGAGGGGGVDETKVIVLSDTIPTADADSLGKFYCYKGTTNASYTHGYVYECVAGSTYYEANIAFEKSTFASESFEKAGQLIVDAGVADPTEVTGGTMTYALAGNLWTIVFTDENGDALNTGYSIYTDDLEQDYDILPVIDPSEFVDGQVVGMAINNVVEHHDYSWERVDLQPAAKLGRYLAGWNCATGLAMTNPPESPYEYTTGDYFIVGVVATGGASNYKPDGSSYTTGVASTTVESESVSVNDMYLYDGTNWTLLKTGSTVTSVNGQTGDVTISANDVLPSQTGNAGKFLTTDSTNATWGTKVNPIEIIAQSLYYTGVVTLKGYNNNNDILNMNAVPNIGQFELDVRNNSGTRTGWYYFDSCFYPHASMTTSTLGKSTNIWANVFTTKINNGADITVPNTAGTMVVADYTGATAGQALRLDSNGNAVWENITTSPATAPTLVAANWSSNTQTITVQGVTATNTIIVSPIPTDAEDYAAAGILCTGQATNALTFTCQTVPASDLQVNIVIL